MISKAIFFFQNKQWIFYFFIWTISVLFSIKEYYYQSSDFFSNYQDDYDDFNNGYLINQKKDIADFEWQTTLYLYKRIIYWVLTSSLCSELIWHFKLTKLLKAFRISITLLFVLINFGIFSFLSILLQPLVFISFFSKFKIKTTRIWMLSFFFIALISYYKYLSFEKEFAESFGLSNQTNYIFILALLWTNLRCIDYFLNVKKDINNLSSLLSYSFYFPLFFSGPIISYADFEKSYLERQETVKQRITRLFKDISRFIFWLLFLEFCLHFLYVNATSFQPQWVYSIDTWALCGYGYLMGQFFHIKYLVIYGLSTSFAKFENIKVPSLPRCIGGIHLYSDMWKYFDNGFYHFLLRCIYIPALKQYNSKFIASFISFTFVYIWHGLDYYIFIWTLLNYIGLIIEIITTIAYKQYLQKIEILQNSEILKNISCFFASFLLAMSAISNFYFFAGANIGGIFVERIIYGSWTSKGVFILALFSCCQFSYMLKDFKANKYNYKNELEKIKNKK